MLVLDRKKEGRLSLVILLLLIILGLLTYRFYEPTGAFLETEDLWERGREIKNQLPSISQGLRQWSYSLSFHPGLLVLEKGEGFFPQEWLLKLPLNLSPRELQEIRTSIQEVFPYGFSLEEKGSAWEAQFFFLTTHVISLVQPLPRARLAIVIDDLGEAPARLDAFVPISAHLSMSVLPRLPNSTRDAQGVLDLGQELLLHQPMEPMSPDLDPGPGAIYLGMGADEIQRILQENLSLLPPEVVGVNNHMGSQVTQEEEVMAVVLEYLHRQGLFFLDSSTAMDSVVPALTRKRGMAVLVNRLFLDNRDDYLHIREMLEEAGFRALSQGDFIAIGHARVKTAQAIQDSLPFFQEKRIQLVHVSDLIR